jgi:predicted metal-binding membrane protein
MSSQAIELVLRRDRAVIVAALVVITGLAWAYVMWLANDMAMGGMDMTGFRMIPVGMGLMMPAAPMVLLYARVGRQAAMQGKPFASCNWFFGGYLLAWVAFALVATLAQWAVQRASLLTPMMESASAIFGSGLLIAAGLYQWTPLKHACLRQCQAPLQFIQRHGGFRRDAKGSLGLGIRHGAYCVGCCWALMALLFVGGVMNLLWIAALTIFVLLEKIIPAGRVTARVAGGVLVAGGGWLLAAALIS